MLVSKILIQASGISTYREPVDGFCNQYAGTGEVPYSECRIFYGDTKAKPAA
jgi:hypothetical protein